MNRKLLRAISVLGVGIIIGFMIPTAHAISWCPAGGACDGMTCGGTPCKCMRNAQGLIVCVHNDGTPGGGGGD